MNKYKEEIFYASSRLNIICFQWNKAWLRQFLICIILLDATIASLQLYSAIPLQWTNHGQMRAIRVRCSNPFLDYVVTKTSSLEFSSAVAYSLVHDKTKIVAIQHIQT